jgi:hypothetical protein
MFLEQKGGDEDEKDKSNISKYSVSLHPRTGHYCRSPYRLVIYLDSVEVAIE